MSGKSECEMTMTSYGKGVVEAFEDHLPKSNPAVPFPQGTCLLKSPEPDPAETAEVLAMGQQRAVGMLLWAQRGVFPECTHGLNQPCRFMSKPTREAFSAENTHRF